MKNGPTEVTKGTGGRVTQDSFMQSEIYFDSGICNLPRHPPAEGGTRGERVGGTGKRPPLGLGSCPPGHCLMLTGFG